MRYMEIYAGQGLKPGDSLKIDAGMCVLLDAVDLEICKKAGGTILTIDERLDDVWFEGHIDSVEREGKKYRWRGQFRLPLVISHMELELDGMYQEFDDMTLN